MSSQSGQPASSAFLGHVLVVDDLPANVRLLGTILKLQNFEVSTAAGGKEALQMMAERTPDVVLLDAMMPEMDGFEVCQQIKENPATAFIPVVMVTALRETSDRVRAIEAGADDFLTKPVEEVEVVARVRSLVGVKRSREALENAYRELQRLEGLRDSLSEMLVHDLRTPLTTMLVSLDMLHSGSGQGFDAMQEEIVEVCVRGGQQLLKLINELLDVGKMESGELALTLESLYADQVIDQAMEGFKTISNWATADIQRDTDHDLPSFNADADLLQRVLINLIGNAVKFTPANGKIIISSRRVVDSGDGAPENLVFSVKDNGPGIPLEDQDKIFEKWGQAEAHKTKRRFSTGLGLTFCKLAVEAHGGRIWIESGEGQGSNFLFTIPLSPLPRAR